MTKHDKIAKTLQDLKSGLESENIRFLVTRFNKMVVSSVDDLDILVYARDFSKTTEIMKNLGYKVSSHDHALGGRIPGSQVNLTKEGRIKIDLHKDFTWRKSRYVGLDFVWYQTVTTNIEGVQVPTPKHETDLFLVLTNIIFEKTYIAESDWIMLNNGWRSVFKSSGVQWQVEKYCWSKSFIKFKKCFLRINSNSHFPVFLPVKVIMYSFYEKFGKEKKIDIISFFYYFFFRTRFALKGVLPY